MNQNNQFAPIPQPGYPQPLMQGATPEHMLVSSAAIVHNVYEGQQSVRLKTNEEWAAEASAKADAAAAAVLRQVTAERVQVLHSNILSSLYEGKPADADVLNEYITLVSE